MARFLKIPGVVFTDNTLPKVESYEDKLLLIPEIKGWFRARTDSIVYESNGEMVWLNEIDNNLHCRQASAAMQPTLAENLIQGHAALQWAGDKNSNLVWDGQTDNSATAKTTRIIVCKANETEGYTTAPFAFGSSAGAGNIQRNALYMRYSTQQFEYAVDTQPNLGDFSVVQLGDWMFAICSFDESVNQNSFSVNGSEPKSITISEPSSGLSDDLVIGSYASTGTGAWNGDIAEFMYIEKDLLAPENSSDLTLIKNYLFAKYGIS